MTYLATFLDELAKFVERSDEVFKTKRLLVFTVTYCQFVRQFVDVIQLLF